MKTLHIAAALIVAIFCSRNIIAQQPTPESVQPLPSQSAPSATSRRSAVRIGQASSPAATGPTEQQVLEQLQEAPRLGAKASSASPYQQRLHQIVNRAQPGGKSTASPLVIRFGVVDAKSSETLEEDLGVMSLLLEKGTERSVGQAGPDYKMGIPILMRSDGQSTRALYLDGFGALFFLNVNIPLVAPPPVEEVKEPKPAADSDWESAKRELYNQTPGTGAWPGGALVGMDPEMVRRYVPGVPGAGTAGAYAVNAAGVMTQPAPPEYDAEQVERLKQELLRALKNATNIRGLKADEFVAVTIFGAETVVQRTVYPNYPKGANINAVGVLTEATGKGNTMTLRAKKADVDAFAKGAMNFEEFQKHATIHVYAGNAGTRPGRTSASGAANVFSRY